MSHQIITDSCCDFTDTQYQDMDVACVPLSDMWDGESHSHFSSECALKDFYTRMRQGLAAHHLRPESRQLGPILGAHTGPGVLGLFHIGLQR